MKFVFTKPPPDVKPILADFRQSVEQSLELPLTLNLYESQFYSRDGALDFSSTRYALYFYVLVWTFLYVMLFVPGKFLLSIGRERPRL
jgi:hypothetical protein